jgi:SAM-dependent methyltransferase
MDLSNVDQQFDLILMMSVLEHVENPFLVAEKLRRIMTRGGYLYLAMPFFYPVHEGPTFGDFWRFTPTSVTQLFSDCEIVSVDCYPSVIRSVADRRNYWNEQNTTYTGFSALLRNQG